MNAKIKELEQQISKMKAELATQRQRAKPQKVKDYPFKTPKGPVKLSQLFGKSDDLLVIHNMGKSCNYCTMWGDVLQGQLQHIGARTAVVLVSPDTPDAQQKLAKARKWKVKMVSDRGGDFTPDMGYKTKEEGYWPGVSGFHRNKNGTIVRTGTAVFGPGDDFCPPWHFFDLLRGGAKGFEPK